MDVNIVIGLIIFCLAYGLILYLLKWSRRTIEMISNRGLNSFREILEELSHGK